MAAVVLLGALVHGRDVARIEASEEEAVVFLDIHMKIR
jgi:hypothetical protein